RVDRRAARGAKDARLAVDRDLRLRHRVGAGQRRAEIVDALHAAVEELVLPDRERVAAVRPEGRDLRVAADLVVDPRAVARADALVEGAEGGVAEAVVPELERHPREEES